MRKNTPKQFWKQTSTLQKRFHVTYLLITAMLCWSLSGIAFTADAKLLSSARPSIVVMSFDNKYELFGAYENSRRHPASLAKLMTLYLLFEELEKNRISLHSKIKISRRASRMPPSKLYLRSGSTITVESAIRALIIKSANDVAVAVSEHISRTEARFARRMTEKAKELNMLKSRFRNASGLHDRYQYSTARDMAKLATHLIKNFPQYMHYFAETSFEHNRKTYYSHNKIVQTYPGADGLKTGFVRASGYNMAATAVRGNIRLVAIVFGGQSGQDRDDIIRKALNLGFSQARKKQHNQHISSDYPTVSMTNSTHPENDGSIEKPTLLIPSATATLPTTLQAPVDENKPESNSQEILRNFTKEPIQPKPPKKPVSPKTLAKKSFPNQRPESIVKPKPNDFPSQRPF